MKTDNEIKLEKELISVYAKLAHVELQLSKETETLKKYKKSNKDFDIIIDRWLLQLKLYDLYVTWDETQKLTILKHKTTDLSEESKRLLDKYCSDSDIKAKILAYVYKPLDQ